MRRAIVVGVVFILSTASTGASEPGQPLDCSDWVILTPGITCTVSTPFRNIGPWLGEGANLAIDNAGWRYRIQRTPYAGQPQSGRGTTEIRRFNGQTEEVVASIADRQGDGIKTPPYWEDVVPNGMARGPLIFDPLGGRLYVPLWSYCSAPYPACLNYPDGWWIASFEGFTPLFEILKSYAPTATGLGFRVPAIPEGLRSADHFDTYWGEVSDLPNFTTAHPMQCSYPSSPPAPGDYLTVADTSPRPVPGHANYIVTAVSDTMQRRYGRQRVNSVLSGRNPALLPGCP